MGRRVHWRRAKGLRLSSGLLAAGFVCLLESMADDTSLLPSRRFPGFETYYSCFSAGGGARRTRPGIIHVIIPASVVWQDRRHAAWPLFRPLRSLEGILIKRWRGRRRVGALGAVRCLPVFSCTILVPSALGLLVLVIETPPSPTWMGPGSCIVLRGHYCRSIVGLSAELKESCCEEQPSTHWGSRPV